MGVPADDERRRLNKIVNPLSEHSPYLRTSLLPGLFAAVARNRSRGNDDLALFEAGSVFFASDPLTAAPRPPVTQRPSAEELAAMDVRSGRQPRHLAAVLTGQWQPDGWEGPGDHGRLAAGDRIRRGGRLAVGLRVGPSAAEHRALASRPVRRVRAANRRGIGYAGELHPEVCRPSACRPAPRPPRSIWTR